MPKRPACFECGKASAHDHHVIARSRGGTQTVPLCLICHGKAHHSKMVSSQLVKDGIARSRANGTPWGKKRLYSYETIWALFEEGLSRKQIAHKLNIPYPTIRDIIAKYNKA